VRWAAWLATAAVRWRSTARAWLEIARGHPRHIVLFSLAAGLALGPISSLATIAAAVGAAALARRRALATLATGAVLLGAVVADARLAALDTGALRALEGQPWEGAATILEPVRERGRYAVARVKLAGHDETAVARLRVPEAAWTGGPVARPTVPNPGAAGASGPMAPPIGRPTWGCSACSWRPAGWGCLVWLSAGYSGASLLMAP